MKPLTFKELQTVHENKQTVTFHPDFAYQEWKDGKGKIFTLVEVKKFAGLYFVSYKCIGDCCKNNSYYHHQLIKENGNHIFDRVEFTETKKQTLSRELPNPVFVLSSNGDTEDEIS